MGSRPLRCGRRVPAPLSAVRGVHGSRATAAAAGPRASRAAVAHGDRRAGRACVSLFGGSSTAAKCRSRRKRWGRCRHPLLAHERRAAPPAQDGCIGGHGTSGWRRPAGGARRSSARWTSLAELGSTTRRKFWEKFVFCKRVVESASPGKRKQENAQIRAASKQASIRLRLFRYLCCFD